MKSKFAEKPNVIIYMYAPPEYTQLEDFLRRRYLRRSFWRRSETYFSVVMVAFGYAGWRYGFWPATLAVLTIPLWATIETYQAVKSARANAELQEYALSGIAPSSVVRAMSELVLVRAIGPHMGLAFGTFLARQQSDDVILALITSLGLSGFCAYMASLMGMDRRTFVRALARRTFTVIVTMVLLSGSFAAAIWIAPRTHYLFYNYTRVFYAVLVGTPVLILAAAGAIALRRRRKGGAILGSSLARREADELDRRVDL